jgi:hypothetical protein
MSNNTWPNNAPFALFLSHDVDQIHDRELFRWLGDINHLRRHWFSGERGKSAACIRRILRPLFNPINPMRQFERIRAIESAHDWCSTFFLLEDKYWSRKGGRFSWNDPEFLPIAEYIQSEGCELGIHGSAVSHTRAEWWRRKVARFQDVFGQKPTGARNHYLSLSVPETWEAQQAAGLEYDATFGDPKTLGNRDSQFLPFYAPTTPDREPAANSQPPTANRLLVLPLTIMDQTLFRYHGFDHQQALAKSKEVITDVIDHGGLVSLLWHHNFFNEPEYEEWERVYADLLNWLAPEKPWCATGREITEWWNARSAVQPVEGPKQ